MLINGRASVVLAATILLLLCATSSTLAQGAMGGAGSVGHDGGASTSAADAIGGAAQATVKRTSARSNAPTRQNVRRRTRPKAVGRPVMDAEDYNEQGDSFLTASKYAEAINSYKQAVRLKPDMAEAHYSLGWIYNEQDEYARALDALKNAVRYNPLYAEAWKELAFAHRNLNQANEAINAYRQAISLNPEYVQAYYELGWTLNELKQYA